MDATWYKFHMLYHIPSCRTESFPCSLVNPLQMCDLVLCIYLHLLDPLELHPILFRLLLYCCTPGQTTQLQDVSPHPNKKKCRDNCDATSKMADTHLLNCFKTSGYWACLKNSFPVQTESCQFCSTQ